METHIYIATYLKNGEKSKFKMQILNTTKQSDSVNEFDGVARTYAKFGMEVIKLETLRA